MLSAILGVLDAAGKRVDATLRAASGIFRPTWLTFSAPFTASAAANGQQETLTTIAMPAATSSNDGYMTAEQAATVEELANMAKMRPRADAPTVSGGGIVWLLGRADADLTLSQVALIPSEEFAAAADYWQVGIYVSTDPTMPGTLLGNKLDIGHTVTFRGGVIDIGGSVEVDEDTYVLAVFSAHSGTPADFKPSVFTWKAS